MGKKSRCGNFWSHYNRAIDQSKPLDKAGRNQKRDETIRDLVQSVVFQTRDKRYGIRVPDQQVAVTPHSDPRLSEQGTL